MTGQGTLMAFRWLPVPAVVRAGEVAARETDARPGTGGFPAPVFFCGLQAVARHDARRETMSLGDGFDSWSADGALSANLCWERDSTDAGWPTTYAPHVRCPICLGQRYVIVSVRSATGTVHTGQSKSFFGLGRARERRGGFTPKAPSPSRFFAVWKAEKICPVGRFCLFILVHQDYCARNYL